MTSPEGIESAAVRAARQLAEFRRLRDRGALCTAVTEQLSAEAAAQFLDCARCGEYLRDLITLLSEIATLEEPCLSQPGQKATFPQLVERLSDSFDPADCLLYDRAFAQILGLCRSIPGGEKLHRRLLRHDLATEEDLVARKQRLRTRTPWRDPAPQRAVRKVLVLSRVTLGADVAVSSIASQKVAQVFPNAQRVLLGPAKCSELFGGDVSLRLRPVAYPSGGTLLDRLDGSLIAAAAIGDEIASVAPEHYAVIDPDSRLLQLGMIPAECDESRYFFFESRSYGGTRDTRSISELAEDWLAATFGPTVRIVPRVQLRQDDLQAGQAIAERLRKAGAPFLIAVSFGVGGNDSKRLSETFERQLLSRLLQDGCTVLLDKGSGADELARADELLAKLRSENWSVAELTPDSAQEFLAGHALPVAKLLTWHGGIGQWSGLIAVADEFIGYDSAGQHIAAALGRPTIDIFTRCATPLFQQRWKPTGRSLIKIVCEAAEAGAAAEGAIIEQMLEEVLRAHREIRSAVTRGRA